MTTYQNYQAQMLDVLTEEQVQPYQALLTTEDPKVYDAVLDRCISICRRKKYFSVC